MILRFVADMTSAMGRREFSDRTGSNRVLPSDSGGCTSGKQGEPANLEAIVHIPFLASAGRQFGARLACLVSNSFTITRQRVFVVAQLPALLLP
jgi:hypothetical protein